MSMKKTDSGQSVIKQAQLILLNNDIPIIAKAYSKMADSTSIQQIVIHPLFVPEVTSRPSVSLPKNA